MNGLTTLGTVLTVVFSVSILVLVVELIYVLWWKQVYRRRSDPEQNGSDPFDDMMPSKDQLLYFFCLKNASRVEPSTTTVVEPAVDDELAKWQQRLYGPTSRVLFTIKEEEEEQEETETETEAENCGSFSIQILEDDGNEEETTPFSTPCASPPYYTPSPSPSDDCRVSVC